MYTEKKLTIRTKKNWMMALYMTLIGVLFLGISIDLFDFKEGGLIANSVFALLFIFGILALATLFSFFLSKNKVLVFKMTNKSLIMSEASDTDDKDFNRQVLLKEITNFYQKKRVSWGGLSTHVNGLFYRDKSQRELLFLDLTIDAHVPEASIEKIIQFVKNGTGIASPDSMAKTRTR